MKRVFATAAILAMLVMAGAAVAVNPTRADNSTSPAAVPSDFVFASPVNASNTGFVKPAVLGANNNGAAHASFSGTDNTQMIDSFNTTLSGPFNNVQLDSSGSLVGSERTVSDS